MVALAITADGTKRPVGLWDGSTENKTVVRSLLADLVDRGLEFEDGLLVVIDGAKALAARGPRGVRRQGTRAADRRRFGVRSAPRRRTARRDLRDKRIAQTDFHRGSDQNRYVPAMDLADNWWAVLLGGVIGSVLGGLMTLAGVYLPTPGS